MVLLATRPDIINIVIVEGPAIIIFTSSTTPASVVVLQGANLAATRGSSRRWEPAQGVDLKFWSIFRVFKKGISGQPYKHQYCAISKIYLVAAQ